MNELLEQLRQSFTDEEYRYSYAESFMNSYVAAQIKILREETALTQEELAERIGTKQAGISRLENVNYSSWKVETLRKIARALGVRLKITFEEFGTLPNDIERFRREELLRAPFDQDPVFSPETALPSVAHGDLQAGAFLDLIPGNHDLSSNQTVNLGSSHPTTANVAIPIPPASVVAASSQETFG